MESSALYAFVEARKKNVVCIAHITNSMGQVENDFEKGPENGSVASLDVICNITKILLDKKHEKKWVLTNKK